MLNKSSLQLILQQGPNPGNIFVVETAPKIIGRGATCDIVIADQSLSRQHVKISPTPTGFCIEDLGSTNGVFVNGRRVTHPIELHSGVIIGLGSQIALRALFQTALPVDNDVTINETSAPPLSQTDPVTHLDDALTAVDCATLLDDAPTAGHMYGPQPTPARQTNLTRWLWVMGALIVALLLIAGALAYQRYGATPAISPTAIAFTVTPVTNTPIPPPKPTTAPNLIRVPGIPALSASKQAPPAGIANAVDPFCNSGIEVPGDEPVLIAWQRRLAAAGADTDYTAAWLAAVSYDITLDGRPISTFNVHQPANDPSLIWWANLGLLPPGGHYLRVQRYANRPVSNGLDVEPADGQTDQFGPGPAGEGFCEIVIPTPETPITTLPASTWTPETEPTELTPTTQPQPQQAAVGPAPLGVFQDFETQSSWKRGDQLFGELTRSASQVFSGNGSGQLSYNFPTPDNDYVVFRQSRPLAGRPNAITAMVYGDEAGHFLNLWIKDAGRQSWSMSFGQVKHTGWQEMTAFLDPGRPWPSGHISGPDNGVIDYPISFEAIVLDDGSDSFNGRGVIYLDDLNSQEGATSPSPTLQPATEPQPSIPNPVVIVATPTPGLYSLAIGDQHRYEEPWGAPSNGNPCDAWRNDSWDDRNANFRGFNVEVVLTNNSATKVQDDWGDGMRFFTSSGQEVNACYYGYAGAGPSPAGATSLTFFTVVPQGSFVQMMQLNLNGQTFQLCMDGRGGWSPC